MGTNGKVPLNCGIERTKYEVQVFHDFTTLEVVCGQKKSTGKRVFVSEFYRMMGNGTESIGDE